MTYGHRTTRLHGRGKHGAKAFARIRPPLPPPIAQNTHSSPRIWTRAWDVRSWARESHCATTAQVLCFYLNTRHSQRARTRPDGPLLLHSKAKIGSKTPTAEDSPQQSQMCAGQHNLEPLAEVERALLVVEVLHTPHPEGLGLLLVVGGEHFCTKVMVK